MMTLSDKHVEMLREAPFIIGRHPGVAQDLCRKGLLRWAEGAWRLTHKGNELLESLRIASAA